MTPGDQELRLACAGCIAALGSSDDRSAIERVVALLRFPSEPVVGQLVASVLDLAEGIEQHTLDGLTSRRLPVPGVVARAVEALRAGDVAAVLQETGRDVVGVCVHLASVAAALEQG